LKINFTYVKNAPIYITDSLYRVRTEVNKTHYRVKEGEEIRYVNVFSLYPYICKYGKFPVGHPKVYVGADCSPNCLDRESVIECKILPPRELYHLVFPYEINSKLMFPLCSACADTMNQDDCTHSDEEPCIIRI
jgi:hypothetical protein